jgi:calcium-binding protein CML
MADDKEVFAAQLSESLDMESGSSEENKLVEMRVHNEVAAEDSVGYNSLSQPPPPVTSSDLSKEQLAEIQDIFSRFDRDQDGAITELELGSLLRSLGLKPNGSQLEALVQRADTNANGYIDFDEFVALIGPEMVATAVPYNQGELLAVFRTFDRDGNGFITAAELAHSMAKLGHALSVKELSDMIREADTDGDGRISFTEFAAAMSSAASGLDVSL